ncbi:MAG TPA: tRNA-(ms[2]io[6]A)-hydroxylase [Flavobacteriales bacterium]|nr:tRNA-(ms[2]io[6]A)-hydroxylase [Flavobacteriales bacterium]
MLGLKLETDPNWVNIVEKNISDILTDHSYCEIKAATNAATIIIRFPEFPELVDAMSKLAMEEMSHFKMVHDKIVQRGLVLGPEKKDLYVNDLMAFLNKGGRRRIVLIDRLLFSAMIEARSCERFRLLSTQINDADLRQFYHDLMVSEATHYTMFIGFARKYAEGIDVEKRWQEFLTYEAGVVKKYGKKQSIHG